MSRSPLAAGKRPALARRSMEMEIFNSTRECRRCTAWNGAPAPNMNSIDWNHWHTGYETSPSLQARLKIVCEQIAGALSQCPPGPIQVISMCAGDGRDLGLALQEHPRRNDVTAVLLDNNLDAITRGRQMAKGAGLEQQMRFAHADAALAESYAGIGHADLVLLSGFLGHLRHENALSLIDSLPMLCKTGGSVIWNRHLVLHDGTKQVARIRGEFRRNNFEEIQFATTAEDGFAVGRARFAGKPLPLDSARKLFEFVGIDQFLYSKDTTGPVSLASEELPESSSNGRAPAIDLDAEKSLVT